MIRQHVRDDDTLIEFTALYGLNSENTFELKTVAFDVVKDAIVSTQMLHFGAASHMNHAFFGETYYTDLAKEEWQWQPLRYCNISKYLSAGYDAGMSAYVFLFRPIN